MIEKFDVLNEKGEFTEKTADRDECHENGLWHRAVVAFIINSKNQVLLQKRSATKKLWPNCWDIIGGHVLVGEFGFQAAIREVQEEIGIDISANDLLLIGSVTSSVIKGDIIDNHFNDYFVARKDIEINQLKIQEDEVQDVKWFDKGEVIIRINNNYDGITDKVGCWDYLKKYLIAFC